MIIAACATGAAQSPPSAPTSLPPVNITAPAPKKKVERPARPAPQARGAATAARVARRRAPVVTRAARVTAPVAPSAGSNPGPAPATATSAIQGYVPRVSATGTKTATPLIETPQSVSVIGAEQIRDLNAQSVVEATRYTSGVVSETFGNDTRNDFLLIRGFPAQVSGYFLDGLQLASPGFATFRIEPYDLERIEVLKGPASVLYGGASTGGIINAVSKRPPLDGLSHGNIFFGVNNYGNTYGRFDLSGPVGTSNQWFFRVEGLARAGGTQTNFTPDDRLSIAPSLTYKPDASTTITVLGSYQKDRTRGENFLPYLGTVQNAPFGKIPTSLFTSDPNYDTFQRNQGLIGYAAEHRFNDVFTVRQNFRYSDLRIDDQTLFGIGYDGNPANANLQRLNFLTNPHLGEYALDTQGEARFRTGPVSHVALLGVDYKRFTFADSQGFVFNTPALDINLLQPVYNGATRPTSASAKIFNTQDQVGIYAQEQAKFDKFTLVLSGRQDSLESRLANGITPAAGGQLDRSALTGRVGLIYTTDYGLAPYGTYATSFDPQVGFNSTTMGLLVPQTGQLTEVGIKYQPIGTRLSFTGALFNLVQQNVLNTDPNNIQGTIQTGEERSRGFELEAEGTITDGLKFIASYTGYQLRDTRDLNPLLLGTVPTNTPQNFGGLFLDYTFQNTSLRGFGFGAGVRYVGGSYAQDTFGSPVLGVPSFILGDATVHYTRENWRAAVNVSNITDKTYVASCQTPTACFYGTRRKALFSLAYSW